MSAKQRTGHYSEIDMDEFPNTGGDTRELVAAMQLAEREGLTQDRMFFALAAVCSLQYLRDRSALAGLTIADVTPDVIIRWMIEDQAQKPPTSS